MADIRNVYSHCNEFYNAPYEDTAPNQGEYWDNYNKRWTDKPAPYYDYATGSIADNNKELILLVAYINLDSISQTKSRQFISELHSSFKNEIMDDINKNTKYYMKIFFIPVHEQETRIECLFPKNVDLASTLDMEALTNLINNKSSNITL